MSLSGIFVVERNTVALNKLMEANFHMVYATAWRIVQNESRAADVTRQTFRELTGHADQISGSLSCWSHMVATRRAIELRSYSEHLRHTDQIAFESHSGGGRTWQCLSCYLDGALEELDVPLKTLLVDHFLVGKTIKEIVCETGISTKALACRVHDGLEQLRAILNRDGLLFTEAGIHSMLMQNSRQAAPGSLLMELAKIKLVGNASKIKGVSASRLVLFAKNHLHRNVLTASVVLGIVLIAAYTYYSRLSQVPSAPVITTPIQPEDPVPEATTAKPQPALDKPVLRSSSIDRAMHTNWSTPENAVHSLMKLSEQHAEDELKAHLPMGVERSLDSSYLKCLGNPIEIIEVIQEENHAEVIYLAAVREQFTLNNTTWLPGDALTLSARFLRIDDLWKCSAIHSTSFEGDTDDAEQNAP
jgi:DNA-directed RNA polymerase specialized sigma24 family protein